MQRRPTPWFLLLLLVFAGCSRCGDKQGAAKLANTPARFLPRAAQASLVVSDLGTLGEKLARFQNLRLANFAAQLQNAQSAEALVSNVMRQVGVDLRSRQAMEAAGIDPGRGAGASLPRGEQGFFVLGVKDETALTETFAKLARERLGATERAEQKLPGGTRVTFSRPGAQQPSLGMQFAEGYVLLGAGPMVAQLASYATLVPEQSLAQEPLLTAGLGRLPSERDFYLFFPGGTGQLVPAGTTAAVTVTGALSEGAVSMRVDAPWPGMQSSLALLAPQAGPELMGYLPEDSFLVMRYRGNPTSLDEVWPALLGERATKALRDSGLDVKADLLEKLKPGVVLGVALAPTAQLGSGLPALDPRRINPFRFVHMVAVGEGKDAAGLAATLEKLPAAAPSIGATVERSELNGQRVYLTSYRQGEGAHFAAVGDKVVLAAPRSRLEAMLPRLADKPGKEPLADDLRGALKEPVFAMVVDLRRLSDSVRALPSEAWGIGGFAIKATTERMLDNMGELRAVTLGFSEKDKAVQAEFTLWLTPAPK